MTRANQPRFGPSGAGVWGTPTVDAKRNLLYITTGDNFSAPATETSDAVMALRLDTGKIVWQQQFTKGDVFTAGCLAANRSPNCPEGHLGPDFDFGSSAVLVHTDSGRELLLAGQKSGMLHALDPDARGAIVWQSRAGKGGTLGGIQWGIAVDASYVYAATSDVAISAPKPGPTAVGLQLDRNQGGGLTAFRIADGSKVWFAPPPDCPGEATRCSPAQSAALTAIPGAVIASGMLFVNSGYSRFGGMPGNVLLALIPENSR